MSYEDHLIEAEERANDQPVKLPIGALVVTGTLSAIAVYAWIQMHPSAASTSTPTASTSTSTPAAAATAKDVSLDRHVIPKDETKSEAPWSATGHWADRSVVWPKHDTPAYPSYETRHAQEMKRQEESPLYPFARQSETNAGANTGDQRQAMTDDVPNYSPAIVSHSQGVKFNRCCINGWYRREHPGECPSHPPPW